MNIKRFFGFSTFCSIVTLSNDNDVNDCQCVVTDRIVLHIQCIMSLFSYKELERALGKAHTFANATHQSWGNVSFKSPYYWELNSADFGAGFMQIGYKLAEISQKIVFDVLVTLTFGPITPEN